MSRVKRSGPVSKLRGGSPDLSFEDRLLLFEALEKQAVWRVDVHDPRMVQKHLQSDKLQADFCSLAYCPSFCCCFRCISVCVIVMWLELQMFTPLARYVRMMWFTSHV